MTDTTDQTDQQLHEAYGRLSTALAPPPDVAQHVVRRVVTRRRRRRVAVGAAALVLAGGVAGTVALLDGGNGNDSVAVDQPGAVGSFTLTRADGTTWSTTDLTVSCQPPPGETFDPTGPQRIYLSSPRNAGADGKVLHDPFIYFAGIVDKIDGQTFTLPVDQGDTDHLPFILFAADPVVPPSAARANEVGSDDGGAAGTVTVTHASCDPTPSLSITADTTLGSEVEEGTEALAGSFSSR